MDKGEDERGIIERAAAGDIEAFSELVRRYQASLRAFAACYVPNPADVQDIVQEAFLKAFRHMDRFDAGREFGPWVRGICRNEARQFLRKRSGRRETGLEIVDAALAQRLAEEESDSERQSLMVALLKGCIAKLNPEHRKLVMMRYYEGTSVKDMAAGLKASYAALAQSLYRIRDVLMRCVQAGMEKER